MTKLEKMYADRAKIVDEQIRIIKSCLAGEIARPDADAKIEALNGPFRELTHRILVCDPNLRKADIGPRVRRRMRAYKAQKGIQVQA
jgi:hypothetical protein